MSRDLDKSVHASATQFRFLEAARSCGSSQKWRRAYPMANRAGLSSTATSRRSNCSRGIFVRQPWDASQKWSLWPQHGRANDSLPSRQTTVNPPYGGRERAWHRSPHLAAARRRRRRAGRISDRETKIPFVCNSRACLLTANYGSSFASRSRGLYRVFSQIVMAEGTL